MAELVSIQEAQRHVRVDENNSEAYLDLSAKLEQATAFVLRLCTNPDDTWTMSTVPAPVKTAILVQLAQLYADRGDEARGEPFGTWVAQYLMDSGYRDPVIA